jgi:hypothetical protein
VFPPVTVSTIVMSFVPRHGVGTVRQHDEVGELDRRDSATLWQFPISLRSR